MLLGNRWSQLQTYHTLYNSRLLPKWLSPAYPVPVCDVAFSPYFSKLGIPFPTLYFPASCRVSAPSVVVSRLPVPPPAFFRFLSYFFPFKMFSPLSYYVCYLHQQMTSAHHTKRSASRASTSTNNQKHSRSKQDDCKTDQVHNRILVEKKHARYANLQ